MTSKQSFARMTQKQLARKMKIEYRAAEAETDPAKRIAAIRAAQQSHNFRIRVKGMSELCDRWDRELKRKLKGATVRDDGQLLNVGKRYPNDPIDPRSIELERRRIQTFRDLCHEHEKAGDRGFFEALSILEQKINFGWDEHVLELEAAFSSEMSRLDRLKKHNAKRTADPAEVRRLAGLWKQYWNEVGKSKNNAHEWIAAKLLNIQRVDRKDKQHKKAIDRISRLIAANPNEFLR